MFRYIGSDTAGGVGGGGRLRGREHWPESGTAVSIPGNQLNSPLTLSSFWAAGVEEIADESPLQLPSGGITDCSKPARPRPVGSPNNLEGGIIRYFLKVRKTTSCYLSDNVTL